MGTWSITPNTLASIDNNGKATFQEHTSQVVYTITYNSDTCGTITKQVTVYPCTQECTCSTTGGLTVPAEASETEVQVGTYSSSNCGGSWSTPTLRSGTDFLKDFRFADGKIYAKVKSTNTDADARSVQYNTGIGTCTDYFTVNQSGTGTCDCTSSRFSVTGVTVDASGGETILIGNFTSECMPLMSFENYAGDTFIDYSKVSTNYDSLTKKGQIYAKVSQNTTSSERMEQPGVLIDGETDFCKHFAVTQTKGICTPELAVSAAENCCVNFKVVQPCTDIQEYDIIEWGYSETNTPIFTNGQAFSSKSATGATGIDQCPSITSDGNWYIFWRNKTAHSVSGSQIVSLTRCSPSVCSIQVTAVGDSQGIQNTTFTCNGETNTSGRFELPNTATSGTVTVNPPSDCKATPSSLDVRCGETMQTEIDRIQKVNVAISYVSQDGHITIAVDAADNEPVDIFLKVHCTDTEGHQSFIETGVTLYCTGKMQTIGVTPPSTEYVHFAEITDAVFPVTETDELCNSGSYICFKLQY